MPRYIVQAAPFGSNVLPANAWIERGAVACSGSLA